MEKKEKSVPRRIQNIFLGILVILIGLGLIIWGLLNFVDQLEQNSFDIGLLVFVPIFGIFLMLVGLYNTWVGITGKKMEEK
jgi:uncharacterized membrane protein